MPTEQQNATQSNSPELYNSRIVHSWLEYLVEVHPGFDSVKLLAAAGINSNQVDDPKQWFTQIQVDRFHAYVDAHIKDPEISRMAGRFVVYKKSPNVLQQYAFGFFDPLSVYLNLPKSTPRVTRGAHIHVNKLSGNRVEILNTPAEGVEEKKYQCDNRLGIYEGIGRLFTDHFSKIEHPECCHTGGDVCRYIVSWPDLSHQRWRIARNACAIMALFVCGGLLLSGKMYLFLGVGIGAAFGVVLLNCMANQAEKNNLSTIVEQQGNAARRLFREIGIRHNTAVLTQEIGSLSSKTAGVDQVLKKVAQAIKKRLSMNRVILIYESIGGPQAPDIANCGYDSDQVEFLKVAWQQRQQEKVKVMARLFKDQEPLLINTKKDRFAAPGSEEGNFLETIGATSFIGVPIVFEEKLMGFMGADYAQPHREVSAIDIRMLVGVVLQMAVQANAVTSYRKLQESEAQYRLMSDHVSDVIWMLDIEKMGFVFVSPSVKHLLGYSAEEMRALSLEDILTPDALVQAIEAIAEELEEEKNPQADSNRSRTMQLEHICKQDRRVWVEITARLLRNDQGKAFQVLGVSRDISERIAANKTQELLREQLERAQKMEALGTLAGGVAHDLNNILSGLVSYPDLLLLELPFGSPMRRPVQTILKSGQRAAAIVQDLLTLARRGVIVTKAIDLNRIILEYLDSPEFEELDAFHPRCEVMSQLASELPAIEGSPVHLAKTVMNLVVNAAEAMPNGGCIEIVTACRDVESAIDGYERIEPGQYSVLQVKDVGIGIEARDLRHIFEPFYTKKIMGRSGTGLGMAVVWGTVKDTNGYLDVVSQKDQGTTFTLYFPVADVQTEERAKAQSIETYVGNGETILVVDDVAEQREIAAAILTELGYQVNTVESGEAAVAYVQSNRVDLVMLDMIMAPGLDGLDTYRCILERHPGQKAVVATGYSETDRVLEVQRLGVAVCIKKPYTIETIGMAVHKVLNGK